MASTAELSEGLQEGAVTTVHRVARILQSLAGAGDGYRLSDVVQATGLGKTTTHRLLGALAEGGFVFQDGTTKRYRLGAAAVVLGQVALRQNFAGLVRPALIGLAQETGDTAFASVLEGTAAVCVAREVGAYPIRTLTLDVGDRRPLGVGAGSLALLAALQDAEIEHVVQLNAGWLARYRAFSKRELKALVARTREHGYALNEGRIVPGMSALGVAVLDAGRPLGSLSLAAITSRVEGSRLEVLAAQLKREAAVLSASLDVPARRAG